ncbi:hypothetical protein [Nocardia sp. NPDC052112]|uniref:hypothetical protein n=1 Tax=Nocardia sp. NPDC052112 TaxID=3155646 RepID=UPI003421934C
MWIPTEPLPEPSDTPATAGPRPATRGTRSFRSPNPRCGNDDIAALGAPALVLGVILVVAGVAALLPARSWPRDYGVLLVVLAYAIYMSLASSLTVWGFRLTRRPRARGRRYRR